MPVYEYVCLACQGRFEQLLPMGAPSPSCPSCHADRVRRQPSMIALVNSRSGSAAAAAPGGCACGGACACGR